MSGNDEIIFTGEYKDFKLNVRFDLSGKEPKDVATILSFLSMSIEPHSYRFAGLDMKMIDSIAAVSGKGLTAAAGAIESTGPSALRESLAKACPVQKLLPAAESLYLSRVLEKAGVEYKVPVHQSPNGAAEEGGGFIGFIGKYGNWIAIKKLGLENVKDYEVSGILAGVNHTVVNKAFDLSGIEKNDALVESVVKGKRRTFGNLAACLRDLEQRPANAYTVCKVVESLGYKPYASPEMLTEAYPDIKPPKVRGRKPKG
ncbi:MAG: DUF2666 family protein [Candidatus Micrarchaeia archaeon]